MKCYEYRRRGLKSKLAKKTSSLKECTEYLRHYARVADFDEALNYWRNFQENPKPKFAINFDINDRENIEKNAKSITLKLSSFATSALLNIIPAAHGLKIQDLLLVGLLRTTQQWTLDKQLTVNICGHGRQTGVADINLSRTVGWINTVFPVEFNATKIDGEDIQQLVQVVIEQLAKVPSNNMDYNILRYITKHAKVLKHKDPEIFFNYVGQIDAIIPEEIAFKPSAGLQAISEIDGNNHLCYLLYLEAGVTAGQLNIRLTYSEAYFSEGVINDLSNLLMKSINEIVALYTA